MVRAIVAMAAETTETVTKSRRVSTSGELIVSSATPFAMTPTTIEARNDVPTTAIKF